MTLADGTPKGMKVVLEERGINTAILKADDMRTSFRFITTSELRGHVEKFILDQGHRVVFLPKFHRELNPLEGSGARQSFTVDSILTTHWLDYVTPYILHLI